MIKLVSFDLDGTLVATSDEIAQAVALTLSDLHLPAVPVALVERHIGHGLSATLDGVMAELCSAPAGLASEPIARVQQASAEQRRFWHAQAQAHYQRLAGTLCQPCVGAVALLQALKARHRRVACVTNKAGSQAWQVLRGAGIAELIDVMIAGDTLPYKKPDPRVLAHLAQLTGLETAAMLHVGDSDTDAAFSRAAGLPAWLVEGGYNAGQPLQVQPPDRLFANLDALSDALLPWLDASRPLEP